MSNDNDPQWEEKIRNMLYDYNEKFHIFKDPKDGKSKVRYIIEDTHKIRFFEFADDIIEKDVFDGDKDLGVLVPRKRGRPKKDISLEPPKPKRERGRPKTVDVEVKEGESRKNKVVEKYIIDRYKIDEEFREKLKKKSRDNYEKTKETIKQNRRDRYARSKAKSKEKNI